MSLRVVAISGYVAPAVALGEVAGGGAAMALRLRALTNHVAT